MDASRWMDRNFYDQFNYYNSKCNKWKYQCDGIKHMWNICFFDTSNYGKFYTCNARSNFWNDNNLFRFVKYI